MWILRLILIFAIGTISNFSVPDPSLAPSEQDIEALAPAKKPHSNTLHNIEAFDYGSLLLSILNNISPASPDPSPGPGPVSVSVSETGPGTAPLPATIDIPQYAAPAAPGSYDKPIQTRWSVSPASNLEQVITDHFFESGQSSSNASPSGSALQNIMKIKDSLMQILNALIQPQPSPGVQQNTGSFLPYDTLTDPVGAGNDANPAGPGYPAANTSPGNGWNETVPSVDSYEIWRIYYTGR